MGRLARRAARAAAALRVARPPRSVAAHDLRAVRSGLRADRVPVNQRHGRRRALRFCRWHLAATRRLGAHARAARCDPTRLHQPGLPGRVPARLPERVRRLHRPAPARPAARPGRDARARRRRPRAGRPGPQRQLPGTASVAPGRGRLLAVHGPAGRRRSRRKTTARRVHGRQDDARRPAGRCQQRGRHAPGRRQRQRGASGAERIHLRHRSARPALPARRPHPAQQSAQCRPASRRARRRLAAAAHARLRRRRARQ